MQKCIFFSILLAFSAPLISMEQRERHPLLSIIFPEEIAEKIEKSLILSLTDIDNIRCVNKGAYHYWNLNKVASSEQIYSHEHVRNHDIREAILASCTNADTFAAIWKIDAARRDLEFSLFCAQKKECKPFVKCNYESTTYRMRQYKKHYGTKEKEKKRAWQVFNFATDLSRRKYSKFDWKLKKLLKVTNFYIFDTTTNPFCKTPKDESNFLEYKFQRILYLKDFQLLWMIMGCKLDPKAFRYLFNHNIIVTEGGGTIFPNEEMITKLFRKEYGTFSAVDSSGATLLHYMCLYERAYLVQEYLKEAVVQNQIVNVELRDEYGCTPFDYLSPKRHCRSVLVIENFLKRYVSEHLKD
jgi:hypothetical protein